ncbi:hypothetical protein D3C76_606760 [compost metagenome]
METGNALDETGDIVVRRAGDDFLGGADLHYPSVLHDGDAVAYADGFIEVMGDEQRGFLHHRGKLQELVLELSADQRVQGAERFVHQEDAGVRRHRACQSDTLLHPAGKLGRKAVFPTRQRYQRQFLPGDAVAGGLVHAAQFEAERDVVSHCAVGKQGRVLEDHADLLGAHLAQRPGVQPVDIRAIDQNLAGGGLDQPVDVADEGRLARAGQPHDAEDLAFPDAEVGIGHPNDTSVLIEDFLLAQPFGLDGGESLIGPRAKNLPDVATFDRRRRGSGGHHLRTLLQHLKCPSYFFGE